MDLTNLQTNPPFHPDVTAPAANPAPTQLDVPPLPPKRKPGRPKGSTKKHQLGIEASNPKIKRPVGRPRKDGFPAGSVSAPRQRTAKPRPHSQPFFDSGGGAMSGVGYPPAGFVPMPSASAPIPAPVPFVLDPNLEADDWAVLARTKPNVFLSTLLSALAAPNPISSAGPSVEEAFRSHLGSLAPNPAQMQPIPSLYSILKTFWLPSSPSYFSLTASASTARTPSEHRFLYWDPQPLVFNGISCPSCSAPLLNHGRISTGPIKIYDIDKPFFIIGCEYVCRSQHCIAATNNQDGRKFASTDSSILRSLPIRLKDEFPARLMYADTDAGSGPNIWNWKALGVSFALWNLVQGCLRAGLRRDAILGLISAVHEGVPEFDQETLPKAEQGHNDDDDEEDEVEDTVSKPPEATGDATTAQDPSADVQNNNFVKKFLDAYNDAWKANSGVADQQQQQQQQQAVASTSRTTDSTTASVTPPQPAAAPPAVTPSVSPAPPQTTTYDFGKSYPPPPFSYPTAYPFFPPAPPGPTSPTNAGGNKRAYPFEGDATNGAGDGETPSKRSPRHCCKCGSQDCKGKGGRSFCTNGCQDCGKLDCKGRNSRRPDKKCNEGWA